MITYEIIKLLSRRAEIKQLENGNGLLLLRLKSVLKSFLTRLRSISFISPFGWQEKDHLSNQHRAPPKRIKRQRSSVKSQMEYLKFNWNLKFTSFEQGWLRYFKWGRGDLNRKLKILLVKLYDLCSYVVIKGKC